MIRTSILLILLFFPVFVSFSFSQKITLSDRAEILVITCEPGRQQLYAAFGHSAFRVYDPKNKIDWVYNYGTFDFSQSHFYLNFSLGRLKYQLARQDYQRFKNAYIYYNRSIYEQLLNLNQSQKQQLFDFLEKNYLPENRFYMYDYFYNNCASKLRDVIEIVFKDSLQFNHDHITTKLSFRELVDIYIQESLPWGDLGIDICLGLPMDKNASPYEYMFLPDYIFEAFANATLITNGKELPLVDRSITTFESTPSNSNGINLLTPVYVFWFFLFCVILITYLEIRAKKYFKYFDLFFFSIIGLLGVFLLFLWFGTDHKSQYNHNLLWAIPFHLPFILFTFKNSKPFLLKRYFLTISILMILLLIFWLLLPQQLHYSLVPILMALSIRSIMVYRAI